MIDFIGDIHGYADKLKELLVKMDYILKNGSYSHPERKVIFVGDYIDRGPQIRETLEIVKAMVDSGSAIALMGNHEYNALCFHYPERTKGGHLREHLIKNVIQHYKTMEQFQNKQEEYNLYIEWFKTLPLFYETENFRAVHASWDAEQIKYLKSVLPDGRLTDQLMYQSVIKDSELYTSVDITLKGRELELPEGISFTDKEGSTRTEIRIKWWEDPVNSTLRSISVEPLDQLPETPVYPELLKSEEYYKQNEKPVFFGHYWLNGDLLLYRDNVCCLDYSVAKEGFLVGYRFDGEEKLSNNKLVYV